VITDLISLPVRAVRTIASLPGRLETVERSMADMQRLLGVAIERLDTIQVHTEAMHGQLGRIDDNTTELDGHTERLADNTDRLVRLAAPLERMGRRRSVLRRRSNGAPEDVTGDAHPAA
jgi:hypothetical protein